MLFLSGPSKQSQVTEREPRAADGRHGFWTTCLAYSWAADLRIQGWLYSWVLTQPGRLDGFFCIGIRDYRTNHHKKNVVIIFRMKGKSAEKAYMWKRENHGFLYINLPSTRNPRWLIERPHKGTGLGNQATIFRGQESSGRPGWNTVVNNEKTTTYYSTLYLFLYL